MLYKQDWAASKERLSAFWLREIVDRCCFSVTVPPTESPTVPTGDAERLRYWTDPDAIIARNRAAMAHTYYGGEAFPQIFINLGAAGHAGFFRGEKHYFSDSVWFFPSLEDPAELAFDEDSFLFQRTLSLARAFVQDSDGDYIVSMPDCTGNIDALSHLMGPERLLAAMLDDPEPIEAALQRIELAYERAMGDVYGITRANNGGGGTVGWLGTWAPGLHAQMQSDLSVMISNPMFERFVMPELRRQCDFLDYPLYHLDGEEQIRHLDSLLSIPKLRAIQWTQVAGQPPATAHLAALRRIQAAGKGLLILVQPDQIEPLMANLSSRGLHLLTTAESREYADALVRQVERLTRD